MTARPKFVLVRRCPDCGERCAYPVALDRASNAPKWLRWWFTPHPNGYEKNDCTLRAIEKLLKEMEASK